MFLTQMNTAGDEFGNEMIDHESFIDSDVEIISSSTTDGAQLRRSSCSSREHGGDHETTETISGVTQPQTNSLLSILKASKASSLSRKRAQARNPPSGKRRCRGTFANEPKGIDPAQRVKKYRNEPFSVANKKLFCREKN